MSNKELHPFFRLFSGRQRLTVQEKETILDALLEAHAVKKAPAGRRWYLIAKVGAVATLILVLAPLLLVYFSKDRANESAEAFTPRGDSNHAVLVIRCVDRKGRAPCRQGGTLAFQVKPPKAFPYFAAFATHRPTQKVIWYYPATENKKSIEVRENSGMGFLAEGIRIGPEHPQGIYDIHGIFSKRALKRDDVRDIFENDTDIEDTADYKIIETVVDMK